MILKHKAELAGRVKLQISGGERGAIDYDWFDNMILDQGLRWLINHNRPVIHSCSVGSSSAQVDPSQTDILSLIARTSAYVIDGRGYEEAEGFGWTRYRWQFARGAAAGNISELAAGSDTYSTPTFGAACRALVRDSSGAPTTITVLSDEVLTVTWEFRRWWAQPAQTDLEYQVDDVTKSTTVSYPTYANLPRDASKFGVAHCDMNTANFSLTSDAGGSVVGENTQTFTEGQKNPALTSVYSPADPTLTSVYVVSLATFTPPIAKTNEFRLSVKTFLTLSRRAP